MATPLSTNEMFFNAFEPKLQNRFLMEIDGIPAYLIKKIDRNQLVGAIFLQPTKTAEFIVLDFNVLPTGATFDGGGGATGGATGGGGGGGY